MLLSVEWFLSSGAGFGPGIPGLQVGFGFGAGCGVGLGFGYGVGRGIAHDEYRTYSNVKSLFGNQHLPMQDEISGLIDELVINTKKVAVAASREIEKWRR
ncbi:keratin, type II cytoskeletal 59 kDa, component IV-like [Gossypium australe]|uniref:Keratin, type II cytoskeletal 59 kDa, component IV-like n=1 Tax=Gossypium australe TaxID=47621 RepID=A0A5B6VH93_9ROSI|nr:keratin, type II cytoskeletal 59 kDa, component IV-like [Gossypium australe]